MNNLAGETKKVTSTKINTKANTKTYTETKIKEGVESQKESNAGILLDSQKKKEILHKICELMEVSPEDISDIDILVGGMTNISYVFRYKGERYIIRIPGVATDTMISRREEAVCYNLVNGKGICEDIIYINPETGYKISKFIENSHVCDAKNRDDVTISFKTLCKFHDMKLKVDHTWNTYEKFALYDSVWAGQPTIFKDYEIMKQEIFGLKDYIDRYSEEYQMVHLDAVYANFLITNDKEDPRAYLIDWEYAAMQDPHVDIVCFGLFDDYNKEEMDWMIDKYFELRNQTCSYETRTKIYALLATFALLWVSWSEAKRAEGQDFTEYAKRQYRYAEEYLGYVRERLRKKSA